MKTEKMRYGCMEVWRYGKDKQQDTASKCGMTKSGFTLIEMVITIVIITILSSISIPVYKNYTKNAMLAEGYVLLSAIKDAQMVYFHRYGNFLYYQQSSSGSSQYTNNDEVLGIDARSNKFFSWFKVCYSNDLKHYFVAYAKKPPELRSTNNDEIALQYNITLGTKFINYPKDYDSSWE